jgi:hypothetical protein
VPIPPEMVAKFDQSLALCKDACLEWLHLATSDDLEHLLSMLQRMEGDKCFALNGLVAFANYGLVSAGRDYNFPDTDK